MRPLVTSCILTGLAISAASRAAPSESRLSIVPVASEPSEHHRISTQEIEALRASVAAEPHLRKPRLELVRALLQAGRRDEALAAAREWRAHDAYNLVAVRLLGDVETEMGAAADARRSYSAIVELLPKDVEARRALATVLKQSGDLEGARRELAAAHELRAEDRRVEFELADVEQRLGTNEDARRRFEQIAAAPDADESLRYPAKQRLAQLLQQERLAQVSKGDMAEAARLEGQIRELSLDGGIENDVKIFLSWDTDRTDVDLWVTTPAGEKVFYSHPRGAHGESLFHDVTTGYGPESFTVHAAAPGDYLVEVDYFGARQGDFKEARGEVIIVLDEGRPTERRRALPYRLFEEKDTVRVARIHVDGGAS